MKTILVVDDKADIVELVKNRVGSQQLQGPVCV
jgi:hypothetical protein